MELDTDSYIYFNSFACVGFLGFLGKALFE